MIGNENVNKMETKKERKKNFRRNRNKSVFSWLKSVKM